MGKNDGILDDGMDGVFAAIDRQHVENSTEALRHAEALRIRDTRRRNRRTVREMTGACMILMIPAGAMSILRLYRLVPPVAVVLAMILIAGLIGYVIGYGTREIRGAGNE